MLSDLGFDHLGAEFSNGRESTVLVLAHESTIANDIRGQDGSETALDGLLCHSIVPQFGSPGPTCSSGLTRR
jgi:hypothetical protein